MIYLEYIMREKMTSQTKSALFVYFDIMFYWDQDKVNDFSL